MENYRQIVYNAVQCLVCNKVIASYHRHDYKTCGCDNEAMVDGGFDYQHYGAHDMEKILPMVTYDDEPYQLVRSRAVRLHREPDGSLKPILLQDMELDWLKAAIMYEIERRLGKALQISKSALSGIPYWHLNLLEKELLFRKEEITEVDLITYTKQKTNEI